ncbi:MAG: gamma-glutamylcyclotransferase family protein [Steroidobacteraceae bacterium]
MNDRRVDSFFYGLFMDVGVLRNCGVEPMDLRRAYIDDFALRIGNRATLTPSAGARSFGMLIALTRPELERLYSAPGLDQYRPEALLAHCLDGGSVPALCYNLLADPRAGERNPDYALKLQKVLGELGFPAEYVTSVASA